MTDQEILYTMALSRLFKLNVASQRLLLEMAGSATAIYENRNDITAVYPEATPKLCGVVKEMEGQVARAEEELAWARTNGIACLCLNDNNYPSRLRECEDAPVVLYYKGNADLNKVRVVSMIGTRNCTEYGKDICRHFLAELARHCPDVLVVSGLAYGIDIHSHRGALENGLDTVGVLAHGLDQIYPSMHRSTAIKMLQQGGLLTEFMSHTNADKVNFVRRNRIVAGMTDATIVVESAEKGGSLITADLAMSYHRDVFAFPGRTSDRYSQGCNQLIRNNKAALLMNADEFVKAMNWESAAHSPVSSQLPLFPELSPEEQRIVRALTDTEGLQINQLSNVTGIPVHRLSVYLFRMEMKGMLRMLAGGIYRLG